MSTISALKRNSASSQLEKLKDAAKKLKSSYQEDDSEKGLWTLTKDANGVGFAEIRFLPAPNDDEVPFVKVFSHGFQGPTGQWYIEKSLTTLGQEDPVSKANQALWATNVKENQDLVRKRSRRTNYYANILVLRDPKKPECEGKVFQFRFGKKLFERLMDVMDPPAEYGDQPKDPFSFFDGVRLKLRSKKVDNQINYDASTFEADGDLLDGDEDKLMEILKQCVELSKVHLDPSGFKSYKELEARFKRVTGAENESAGDDGFSEPDHKAASFGSDQQKASKPAAKPAPAKQESEELPEASGNSSDDDDFFRSLE